MFQRSNLSTKESNKIIFRMIIYLDGIAQLDIPSSTMVQQVKQRSSLLNYSNQQGVLYAYF